MDRDGVGRGQVRQRWAVPGRGRCQGGGEHEGAGPVRQGRGPREEAPWLPALSADFSLIFKFKEEFAAQSS